MSELKAQLKDLSKKHDVPGASLAILTDDGVETAVSGVLNRNTKVTVTPDSVFQIGSITKVYTTTLVMQLVDEGLVDLDATVVTYLPDFKLTDQRSAERITVRQLVTHTNGIEGDYFADFGRGDDAVERYVSSLADIGLAHPVGEMWSYSNAALVVAGRIVEVVTGLNYDQALQQKIFEPAGLGEHVSLAEDAILLRTAAGHVHAGGKKRAVVAKPWGLPRSTGPAGATICASARDVAAFGAIHMNDGRAANGNQIVSPASVKLMQTAQYKFPYPDHESMGLGWILEDWATPERSGGADRTAALWHNGGTVGQYTYLCVIPERRFAFSLLTNADSGPALVDAVFTDVLKDRLGISRPEAPEVPAEPIALDLQKYAGSFERLGVKIDVEPDDGKLKITMKQAILEEIANEQTFPVTPLKNDVFAMVDGEGKVQGTVTFQVFDADGRPEYISVGRVAKRVQ